MKRKKSTCRSCSSTGVFVYGVSGKCAPCFFGVTEEEYYNYLLITKQETYQKRRTWLRRRVDMLSMYSYMLNRHLLDPENLGRSHGDYRENGGMYSLDHIISMFTFQVKNRDIRSLCHPMNLRVFESSANKRKKHKDLYGEERLNELITYHPFQELEQVLPMNLMDYITIREEDYEQMDFVCKKSIRKFFREYVLLSRKDMELANGVSPK